MVAVARCLPHGCCSLIPAMLVTMGWMAALFQDGCDYSRVEGDIVTYLLNDTSVDPPPPWMELGVSAYRIPTYHAQENVWRTVYTGTCLAYPNDSDYFHEDPIWKACRFLAFGGLVLGGGSTIFLWFSTCCIMSTGTWRLVAGQVLVASLFQSLVFLWFASDLCKDNDCNLFWGSRADIVASSLWFTAAMIMCIHYPKPKRNLLEEGSADGLVRSPSNISRADASTVITDTESEIAFEEEGDMALTTINLDGEKKEDDDRSRQQTSGESSSESPTRGRTSEDQPEVV